MRRPSSPGSESASVRATSASPEWSAQTGRAPAEAASAATMPNASGKVLGTTIASLERTTWATSPYSSLPARSMLPAAARAASA